MIGKTITELMTGDHAQITRVVEHDDRWPAQRFVTVPVVDERLVHVDRPQPATSPATPKPTIMTPPLHSSPRRTDR